MSEEIMKEEMFGDLLNMFDKCVDIKKSTLEDLRVSAELLEAMKTLHIHFEDKASFISGRDAISESREKLVESFGRDGLASKEYRSASKADAKIIFAEEKHSVLFKAKDVATKRYLSLDDDKLTSLYKSFNVYSKKWNKSVRKSTARDNAKKCAHIANTFMS